MENLGPFNLFFTLSCGEKRYNENFTTFLKGHNVTYEYKQGREEVFVDGAPLEEFLQQDQNQSKHDFIKDNILRQTLVFDNRVKEFISTIMMNKEGPFCVKYYNYRVEFQLRGAAHIHGTIWVDFEKHFKNLVKSDCPNGQKPGHMRRVPRQPISKPSLGFARPWFWISRIKD